MPLPSSGVSWGEEMKRRERGRGESEGARGERSEGVGRGWMREKETHKLMLVIMVFFSTLLHKSVCTRFSAQIAV